MTLTGLNWNSALLGVRNDEEQAVAEVRATLAGGLRLLLKRRLGAPECDEVLHGVLDQVMGQIAAGTLTDASQVARTAREAALHLCGGAEGTAAVVERTSHPIVEATLATLSAEERSALRDYYLNARSLDEACSRAGVSRRKFAAAKSRVRSALSPEQTAVA